MSPPVGSTRQRSGDGRDSCSSDSKAGVGHGMVSNVNNNGHGYSGERPHGLASSGAYVDRTGKHVVALLFLATGVTAAAAAAVVPALIAGDNGQPLVQEEGAVFAGLVAGTVALLWFAVRLCLLRPCERLAYDTQSLVNPASSGLGTGRIQAEDFPDLAPLPDAINMLGDRLALTRRDLDRAVAESVERLVEQKSRLTAILRDLEEGVLVCDLHHQVLVHNPAALKLLRLSDEQALEPGRTLFSLMLADPIRHTLERLNRLGGEEPDQPGISARFLSGTLDGRVLLDGRMSLILENKSRTGGVTVEPAAIGYVLTFTDATRELAALGRRDALLHATTEALRAPLANLRAVMETLEDCPEIENEARAHLEAAMLGECESLTVRLEGITEQYRATVVGTWPMSDLRSHTLIDLVRHRVAAHQQITITPTGMPCLLHGDSFSLVALLDHLIERVGKLTGAVAFDLAADAAARWTYLDLVWTGAPVPSTTIDQWKGETLAATLGGLTVGDVLRHHRSDLWSEARPDGRARLRLPLPPTEEPAGASPPRPVIDTAEPAAFLAHQSPSPATDLTTRPLRDLDFVVFDIESTGADPIDGDEIVAIAAVRVVNRRILTGDTFQALVNPGRPLSPQAARRHGIAARQLHNQPDITSVLPQFKAFVGNTVMVGHHAGLELAFLRLRERACGVRFDNTVLDTKLLSLWLQGRNADHSLDAVARRLGIAAIDRHTTLGDCLTTAAVLVAMLDLLPDRGLVTLGDVLREANKLVAFDTKEPPP